MTRKNLFTIAAIAIILVLAAVFLIHLNGGSLDFSDREIRLIITDSMDGNPTDYPISTIEKDSLVMVRHINQDEISSLEIGTVMQFKQGDILNHHRLVSIDVDGGFIITKGDNLPVTETIFFEDVTGVVVGKNHPAGIVVSFVKDNLIFTILAIIVLMTSAALIREILAERKDREEGS